MRSDAAGLNRATRFRIGSVSPFIVTWSHACTTTVSARWRSVSSSQLAMRWWPSVPGTRGPNSTWVRR